MNGSSSDTLRINDRSEPGSRRAMRAWPKSKNGEIRIEQGKDTRFLNEVILGLKIYSDHSLF
jgi:hypothetical protein